jgi:hypothetical protein
MAKKMMIFTVCLVAWFFYFQALDWFLMSIQGLDYFAGLR